MNTYAITVSDPQLAKTLISIANLFDDECEEVEIQELRAVWYILDRFSELPPSEDMEMRERLLSFAKSMRMRASAIEKEWGNDGIESR